MKIQAIPNSHVEKRDLAVSGLSSSIAEAIARTIARIRKTNIQTPLEYEDGENVRDSDGNIIQRTVEIDASHSHEEVTDDPSYGKWCVINNDRNSNKYNS